MPSAAGGGYVAELGAGNVSSAKATLTVPAFSCASGSDQEWLLPGIWVIDSSGSNLTQQVDVNANCNDGSQATVDVVEAGGTLADALTINPGDKVKVSLSETATATVGTVHDITQGTMDQAVGDPAPNDSLIFVGDFGPSLFGVPAVPTFKKVPFSTVTINGHYLSDMSPGRFNLVTGSDAQIKSTRITGRTSFATRFENNN